MTYFCCVLNLVLTTSICILAVCLVGDAASVELRGLERSPDIQRVEDLLQELNAEEDEPGKRAASGGCSKNKCVHGKCNASEGPIPDTGLDYYCVCNKDYGGYFCQLENPCDKCPSGTKSTLRTSMAKSGCFCYDKRAKLLPIT